MVRRQALTPTDIGIRRRCAGLRAALVTAGFMLVSVASAHADPVLVVASVFSPNASPTTESVTRSEITGCPPVPATETYINEYGPNGTVSQPPLPSEAEGPSQGSWPLSSALGCMYSEAGTFAPITVGEVNTVVVSNDGTPETPLQAPGDLDGTSFENGLVPVIVQFGPSTFQYFRPVRYSGDENALDDVSQSDPINIQVAEGKTFPVSITASPTSIVAGQTVVFTAVPSDPSGDALSYAWDFDGGATNSTVEDPKSVEFDHAGTFNVTFQATDAANRTIGPASVTIIVQPSSPQASTQTGASTSPVQGSGPAATGPVTSTGTTPGASPDTTTIPAAASTSSTAHTSTTPAATTTRAATTATTPTTSTPTTTRTTPAAAGASSGSGSGMSGAGSNPTSPAAAVHSTASASSHPVSHRSAQAPSRRPPAAGTKLISGRLISGVAASPASSGSPTPRAGAVAHAPALASAGHVSRLAAVAGGAGVLLLLGLGVGQELKGRRFRSRGNRPRTA